MLSWRVPTSAAAPSPPPPPRLSPSSAICADVGLPKGAAAASLPGASSSLRLRDLYARHTELQPQPSPEEPINNGGEEPPPTPGSRESRPPSQRYEVDPGGDEEEDEISGIQVPRQRHIPVSKSELLDGIVSEMFRSPEDADEFLILASSLDSILHAEHKSILEEMRIDYTPDFVKQGGTDNKGLRSSGKEFTAKRKEPAYMGGAEIMEVDGKDRSELDQLTSFSYGMDLRNVLRAAKGSKRNSVEESSRVANATRFQHAFVQLLHNAQFEELSARDLMLTSALNTDYLLTLPVYVDWKRASKSNVIIFRFLGGDSNSFTEFNVSTPLLSYNVKLIKFLAFSASELKRGYATEQQKGLLLAEKLDFVQSKALQQIFSIILKPLVKVLRSALQAPDVRIWTERIESRLKQLTSLQQAYSNWEHASNNSVLADQLSNGDLPIWLAAQRAVSRYEGLLAPVGPRGRLRKKLFMWLGLAPSTPSTPFELDSLHTAPEPYLRPSFLPRISLSDIWRPASKKHCKNNFWRMLKTSVSIVLSQSVLQEPAFQELILLYSEEVPERESEDKADIPSLQLKIYEKIPIPDLPVIFPHKKLSFRILDTIRLDVATILGLLAFFVNYKFEDILSSPSAILLDVIAISALVLYVTRVVLGYKQTWDRYQLLVNRTLNEKTIASGFGSVHFLLDASEQQLFKEAILVYAILLKMEGSQVPCQRSVGDKCERFMYEKFREKVEMPISKAMDTLTRLGLVTETDSDGKIGLQAVPCPEAYVALKQRWNSLLH